MNMNEKSDLMHDVVADAEAEVEDIENPKAKPQTLE